MPTPILATKLFIPPPRPKVVLRSRLIKRLNENLSLARKLTLISASAGFGKTTLVSEWVAGCGRPVAWLSLDEDDSDPSRFLIYLVTALQTIAPNFGEGLLAMIQSSQLPRIELMLTTLLNEIAAIPQNFIVILDDYHVVDSTVLDNALAFLLEHLPTQMHLLITTREDPNLPLAKLRVRGQLTELRAADLRFTPSETAEFLKQSMGLNLSAEDIAALEARTEGWVAGLQLAALSMQGHQDSHGFVQAFAGDHRHIVDYLVEEVLQRQPEPIRNFLLQTAILDRLNGSLCDAVTGQPGGKARLETLQRGNFFLIPLDDKGHWYRYQHLFADVLSMHLMVEQADQIPALHRRASEWYEQNGLAADAIRHALAGADFERAAGLIELAAPAMHKMRQEATLLALMKALPDALFPARPVLSVLYVGALMSNGGVAGVETLLQNAERWLNTTSEEADAAPTKMVVVNEEEFHRLPGAISMYRAGLALARGDAPETVRYAQRVFDLVPKEDHLARGAAAALIGLARWTKGDLDTAHQMFADGMAHLQLAGNISDAVGGVLALGDIRITQGRLHDAMHTYERALQLAKDHGTPTLRGTADMYVGMSQIECEHNNLNAAMQHLMKSRDQGEHTGFPQHPYRWRVAMARLRQTEGDPQAALDLLEAAAPLYVSDFFPNVLPISALKTRIWLAQGRLDQALHWARERGLSTDDDLTYLHEFEHITLARILLAQYKSDATDRPIHEAIGFLERLLKAAQAGGRMGSVIEILILQALAHQCQGNISAGLVPLEHALTLAEPQGYTRIFLDEGPPMAQLLREAAARKMAPNYTNKLLSAFAIQQPGSKSTSLASQPLIESLSQRELEVLRLFKTDLSGPEIARELVIALSTVRTHTKGIYSKLNVTDRRAAVKRAVELGLI